MGQPVPGHERVSVRRGAGAGVGKVHLLHPDRPHKS